MKYAEDELIPKIYQIIPILSGFHISANITIGTEKQYLDRPYSEDYTGIEIGFE